jgi:hypothetical protein
MTLATELPGMKSSRRRPPVDWHRLALIADQVEADAELHGDGWRDGNPVFAAPVHEPRPVIVRIKPDGTSEEYESITAAEIAMGVRKGVISNAIYARHRTRDGSQWIRAEGCPSTSSGLGGRNHEG